MPATDVALFRSARKDDFEGGVIVDGHAVRGVLYPTFESKEITKKRGDKIVTETRKPDVEPYLHEGGLAVKPGGGASLWDRQDVFGTRDWWNFTIPKGTVVPESLSIRKGSYVTRFNATHYQIEPALEHTPVDAYKGALDNLARNAVVKLYEDARK